MRVSVTILLVLVAGVAIGWHFLPQPAWMKGLIDWYHGLTKKVGQDPNVPVPADPVGRRDVWPGGGKRREPKDTGPAAPATAPDPPVAVKVEGPSTTA